MRSLSRCHTADNVLKMFRDVKLRSLKKTTGGASASVADSLATSERIENLPKKTAEFEAQLRPPKKSVLVVGTRKRGHKTTGEKVARVESPFSSSDSFSGSTAAPPCPTGTPVTEDDFSGNDVDKLAAGRSKRKKVDEDDLARRMLVKDVMRQSREALEVLKAREEAAEKGAGRSPKLKAPKKCSREVARASRQAAEKASREGADKGPRHREGDSARFSQSLFRDPPERPPRRFSESPLRWAWRKVPETLRRGLPRDLLETLPRHPSSGPLSFVLECLSGECCREVLQRCNRFLGPSRGESADRRRRNWIRSLWNGFVCTRRRPLLNSLCGCLLRHLLEHVDLDYSICSRMVSLTLTPSSGYSRSTRQHFSTSSSTSLIRKKRTSSSTVLLVRGWRGTTTSSRRTLWMETTIPSLKSSSFAWRR
jgi:hypothetical protein